VTLDLIRIGLDEPADYRIGMATILNRTARLALGEPGAVILGQSRPILTTGDQPSAMPAEPTARPGGLAYYGPGVLLVSPVVVADVTAVHETLLLAGKATCAEYGVTTVRRPHYPGLWVNGDGWRKVASIGLAEQNGIVAGGGGLALNVCPDPSVFDDFDACSIPGVVMTSLAAEAGRALTVAEVAETLAGHLERLVSPSLVAS
jgi:lipoyl(octanoyl) transferase